MMASVEVKRKLTYLIIALYFFLSGVEYAVMLPTMWLYVHNEFNATTAFFGLLLSAFSISDLFCSPIYGRLFDKYRRTKFLILFSNLWEIAGNIMYFMGISLPFLLASRFVTGIGAGAGAAMVSDIAHTTSADSRTGAIAVLMSCRQVGLVIGPGCNIFLRYVNTSIGPYALNAYTVPGIFMAALWILHSIVCAIFYTDFIHLNGDQLQVQNGDEQEEVQPVLDRTYYANEYLRHEVIAILSIVFASLFNQTALEAMLTPLTKKFLDWGEMENSFIYLGAGIEVIVVFLIVRCASRRFYDSTLIIFGCAVSICAMTALFAYLPTAQPGNPWNLPLLISGVVLDVIALPFLVACSVSLYSKVTSPATQGFSQGLRRSVIGLATILGPLWAGSLFNNLWLMLGALLAIGLLMAVLFCLSTPRLRLYERPGIELLVAEA